MTRTLASRPYSDSANSLITSLDELKRMVPADYDQDCINVDIFCNPDREPTTVFLVEETLSDKSVVYNIEVY